MPGPVKPSFTTAEIEKIAELAKIELNSEEKENFSKQFNDILGYFRKIQDLDLAPEDPEVAADVLPRFRDDRTNPSGITPEEFSPYLENGHYKVPKVIE